MKGYSVILGNLGNTCDRFLSSGYKDQPSKEAMLKQASEIQGIKGVELVGSWDITESNVEEIGNLLDQQMKEPRTHSYLARAADTLLVAKDIGMPNVGVTIDTGYSVLCGENVAEAVAILQQAGNKTVSYAF